MTINKQKYNLAIFRKVVTASKYGWMTKFKASLFLDSKSKINTWSMSIADVIFPQENTMYQQRYVKSREFSILFMTGYR